MPALETIERISQNSVLLGCEFRYCLVGEGKIPYKADGSRARPNAPEDFCSFEELLLCPHLESFEGIGISVKASGICAIDVDKCFSEPFDASSGDGRAEAILGMLKDKAYVEFSFSGTGLRILFYADEISGYSDKYYTKNDKNKIEFYPPGGNARYVTLTGMALSHPKAMQTLDRASLLAFLDKYMTRPHTCLKQAFAHETEDEELPIEELMKKARSLWLRSIEFQDLWFGQAPGSGSNESQLDFHLLSILYREITKNKENLIKLFEASEYFKTKDWKHVSKWNYNNHRYFEFMYKRLED